MESYKKFTVFYIYLLSLKVRIYYIIGRWLQIVIYTIVGVIISAILFQYGSFLFDRYKQNLPDLNYDVLIILYYCLLIFGILIINQVSKVKLSHFRQILTYPPFIISILFALLITPLFTRFTSLGYDTFNPTYPEVIVVSLLYVIIFIIQQLTPWRIRDLNNIVSIPSPSIDINLQTSNLREISDNQILKWIEIEEPINSLDQDLFQFIERANHVHETISKGIDKTVAILGKYGSGKSSLIELIERISTKNKVPKLWFAKTNCWGFEDSSKAQEIILKQAIESLSNHVDCLSINRIPRKYVTAISKINKYADIFISVFDSPTDPSVELQRISPILIAVNARLIIVIEDTDRNGVRFNAEDLEALLFRLKQIKGISYILTTNISSNVDFAKLCEQTESIPTLDEDQTLHIIDLVRNHCLNSFPNDIHPAYYSNKLATQVDSGSGIRSLYLALDKSWYSALIELLSTPRHLKRTLRRTINTWSRLHGEVDFDELLIVTALRETATPAFSYLTRHYKEIRSLIVKNPSDLDQEDRDQRLQNLKDNWNKLIDNSNFDPILVSILMREILPETDFLFSSRYSPQTNPIQGTRNKDAPVDYGERYFSESIMGSTIRDQSVLHTIKNINSDINGTDTAVEKILTSEEFSKILEYYGGRIEEGKLLPLLTSLYKLIRNKMGNKASREATGFIELWRYGRYKIPQLPGFKDWIYSEISKSFPNNIRFVNDLYYWWFSAQRKVARTESVRKHIFNLSKEHFEKLSPKDFANCFDYDYPWTLFQLVFTGGFDENIEIPLGNASDWSWLGPVLINASKKVPAKINSQIASLCQNKNLHSPDKAVFEYDDDVIDGIFNDRKKEIMLELAKPYEVNPNLSQHDKDMFKLAIKRAQRWLEKNV